MFDTHGKLAYIGHPASRDLQADINTLLKGEALTGIQAASENGGSDTKENFKDLDLIKVDEEIEHFKSKIDTLTSN